MDGIPATPTPRSPGKESARASDPALVTALFELSERIVREKSSLDALLDWPTGDSTAQSQKVAHSASEPQKQQQDQKKDFDAKNNKPTQPQHGLSFADTIKS